MKKYRLTLLACYISLMVQALVINFTPLLFVMFQTTYTLTLSQISALIIINFASQLAMDFLSSWYVDAFGYRRCGVLAHLSAVLGMVLLAVLPDALAHPFAGLCVCMVLCGMGGGLIEVVVSPIVEALPTASKSASMSLLHSFYSWGQLLVVILSTVYFTCFGLPAWRLAALLWALVPLVNGILFCMIPLRPLMADGEKGQTTRELLQNKFFWLFLMGMTAAGASEQALVQWASLFAEKELHLSKSLGDLLGPCMFALLMGLSRVLYSVFHERLKLWNTMFASALVLLASYVMVALFSWPPVALLGCGLCGMAAGIMWPGMLSLASRRIKRGGTAMYAMLAFFGDVGCITGPGLTGLVSDAAGSSLHVGFLASAVFPVLMIISLLFIRRRKEQ